MASRTPRAIKARLARAAPLTARPALLSSPERERAVRGGTVAASQAGGAAASTVAATPSSSPLSTLLVGMATPRTVSTK
jgi:hypothetical protein